MARKTILIVGTTIDRMLLADGLRPLIERNSAHADITGFDTAEDVIAYMDHAGIPGLLVVHARAEFPDPAQLLARYLRERAELRRLVVHAAHASSDLSAIADGDALLVIDASETRARLCRTTFDAIFLPAPVR